MTKEPGAMSEASEHELLAKVPHQLYIGGEWVDGT